MDKLPISVCIATRNEAHNIRECLECVWSNSPEMVIVIDAGSVDGTPMIAREMGALVVETEARGLAWQRQVGLEYVDQPYTALVDAHDRLDSDCLSILLDEIRDNDWKAIQASIHVLNTETYWEKAYFYNSTLSINVSGSTNMVGRPCVYETDAIKKIGFDSFFSFGVGCEDTDVSIQFEKFGYGQAKGTGKSYRAFPSDFIGWWKKWVKYGRGDARISKKYPEKRWQIIKHQLWVYPFVRNLRAIRAGGVAYIPFFLLFGWVRFGSSVLESLKLRGG